MYRHPVFGEVPTIEVTTPSGHTYRDHDPDFRPPLPNGAIRGDVRRQVFCSACHVPKYFYVDEKRTCVQCDREFVFGAREQKFWYETLRFNFGSTAIRCPSCRRHRRSQRALRAQIAAALAGLREDPDDPALLLADAEATVRLHQRVGEGNLDRAIASCRKALRIWPRAHEALFWEGLAQRQAGRRAAAAHALTEFLRRPPSSRRAGAQRREAKRIVEG